jgi:rhodanese-related sulfurtransferase
MKTLIRQVFTLVFLAAAAAMATYHWHPRAPALYAIQEPLREDEVDVVEVQKRWAGQVIWLDARPRDQFEVEHIPGALILNEQEFDQQLLEILDTLQTATKPVVIYCGGQKCEASRHVREKLMSVVALDECYVLKGGWPAWKALNVSK